MFHRFRNPKLNGFLLGLLQGVPQGLSFPDQKQYVGLGFDNEMVIPLACFGFFGPPVFVAMSHFMNRGKYLQWWSKVMEYVNLYHMLFWGCLSLASLAYFSLRGEGASEGYAVCAFFAASGIGFLIAGRVDAWLQRQRVRNAI